MSEPATTTPFDTQIAEREATVAAARTQPDPTALIHSLIHLGQAYLDSGNVPKGLTQFEEALALAQSIKDELLEARLWGYKGICLMRLGNSHFAQIALYKSQNMAKALNHIPLLIDALTQLGNLQLEMGETTKAISRFEQAYGFSLSIGDRLRAMHLAGKAGGIFLGLSALEKASEYYTSGLAVGEGVRADRGGLCLSAQPGHCDAGAKRP